MFHLVLGEDTSAKKGLGLNFVEKKYIWSLSKHIIMIICFGLLQRAIRATADYYCGSSSLKWLNKLGSCNARAYKIIKFIMYFYAVLLILTSSTINLGAIFIAINSWNNSLQAYGRWTWEIWVLFLQTLHSNEDFLRWAIAIRPHRSQTWIRYASEASNKRSWTWEDQFTFKKFAAPCEIIQSRSISPKRRPPSLDLPSTGWRVRIWTGPRARLD